MALILALTFFFGVTEQHARQEAANLLSATVKLLILKQPDYDVPAINEAGTLVIKKASTIINDKTYESDTIIVLVSLIGAIIVFFITWIFLRLLIKVLDYLLSDSRNSSKKNKRQFIQAADLKKLTEKKICMSKISFSGIPLPEKCDTGNMMIVGSPDSRSSINIKEILFHIRISHCKTIIYDGTGELIRHFYREGTDVILNPLDRRSASWDIWCDCRCKNDYALVAKALIPDNPDKKDWVVAARIVLAKLAEAVSRDASAHGERPTTAELIKRINAINNEQITQIIEQTEEALLICKWAEKWHDKAYIGIRGILLSCLSSLEELSHSEQSFSIRQWINHELDDSWLFISSPLGEEAFVSPLISMWLEIACCGFRTLSIDRFRRYFFVIDDVTSINPIPSLKNLMVQSKRQGVCTILGMDSVIPLLELYDRQVVQSMTRFCETWVVLRSHDLNTAQWLSAKLEGDTAMPLSLDGDDEISSSPELPVVTPEDICELTDMKGFIRMGSYPVAKFNSVTHSLPAIAQAFVSKKQPDDAEAENSETTDSAQTPDTSESTVTADNDINEENEITEVDKAEFAMA